MSKGAGTRIHAGSATVNAVSPLPAVGIEGRKRSRDDPSQWTVASRRIHMIGIGGCGMCGAAGLLLRGGARVTGSDRAPSEPLTQLARKGAEILIGQRAEHLPDDCDVVVYSAAIKETNPELAAARARGLEIIKYSELLGRLMSDRVGVAVAGTHGKSTTTAMVAYVLREARLDPSFVIGAQVDQLGGSSGVGDGAHFVVEACEFDRSFLNLRPRMSTILNLEEDHLDYYPNLEAIIEAFGSFASRVPPDGRLVINGEDDNVLRAAKAVSASVETFGFEPGVDWRADEMVETEGCFRFRVLKNDHPLTDVSLAIPGRHNVANALAATAICFGAGVEPECIAEALGRFDGVERRLTRRGRINGVTVVDDYGHHPTEIRVTLEAARAYYRPRKMYVVFQPHQHSRTRFLLNDFAVSFSAADVVIVPDIYFVRDSESERDMIDAADLVERIRRGGGDARYEASFDRIASTLCDEVRPGDLVVTMGAGDVWQVADRLLDRLASE